MKLVIVEDSPLVQALLTAVVMDIPGVHIVGTAISEAEAVSLIEREQPDIVLLDLSLSPGHGFNVLKTVRDTGNRCKMLVVTNEELAPLRPLADELGADAMFDKCTEMAQIVAFIAACMPPARAVGD